MGSDCWDDTLSRRGFIKAAAGVPLFLAASRFSGAFAAGSDTIRIGLIGSGERGHHDMAKCLKAAPGLELVAMGDLFKDRLDNTLERFRKENEKEPEKIKVTPETCFVGWDAYQKVLATDCHLVLLTTPPQFRPLHLRAALEAGKHVFIEKPVAVDPVGVRHVIESADLADQKNLTILAGTQARRMEHRRELVKRIQNGDIGEIISGQCVRTGDAMRTWGIQERKPEMTDMEWQVRRWLFNTWLSGDFIAEMHIHELDITNWLIGEHPVKCMGIGGRQVRTDTKMFGDVYDHFSIMYEYPNGVQVSYLGEQIDAATAKTYEKIRGTKGTAYTDWSTSKIEGEKPFAWEGPSNDPEIQQFKDQIEAIRNGTKLNEAKRVAESTMTAILGRMSCYTGLELKWDWAMKSSKLDLTPEKYEFGPRPEPVIALPGKTQIV